VANPRIYLAVGGLFRHYNYLGYPNLSAVGGGLEKLPDLDQPLSLYGSVYFFPNLKGTYTYPTSTYLGPLSGSTTVLSYNALLYDAGLTLNLGHTGLFLEGGYQGERLNARTNAPANVAVSEPYVGLGFKF